MLILEGRALTLEQIASVAYERNPVVLGDAVRGRMQASRDIVEAILDSGKTVYGVNTGFGKLSDVHVPPDELQELQLNLVRSHACGVGEPLGAPETRALMLLRANVLAAGYSGARPVVAETLVAMLNANILPLVPSKGSVGASGDLAPLAHLALGAIGEGDCLLPVYETAEEALRNAGIDPLSLEAKEGLALLNGTQAIVAVASLALQRAERLIRVADVAGIMTLESVLGTPAAFDERIQGVRPHPGQAAAAKHLRDLMRESEIRKSHAEGDPRVQDAYCLRCMPQVHGAVRGVLSHVRQVFEIETASATDNPLVFDNGDLLSGGNFHGAPLGYALDYAAVAITDLMNISERRIDRLINPDLNEHLPPFLTPRAGSSSGFMIPHVTAVALLNEAKILAHPASVDNLPTSGGKEDHVSMGMSAALKFRQIVDNAEMVVAIELLAAGQGLEFRKPLKPGAGALTAYESLRRLVPWLEEDRSMTADIEAVVDHLDDFDIAG
ncbi:MAG TPA: histidine ammonia-lyase [Fimbriimonadaceae bacterium]|nr:histidine ammonia-lyase [Fimbriimonadaceae bacterium]